MAAYATDIEYMILLDGTASCLAANRQVVAGGSQQGGNSAPYSTDFAPKRLRTATGVSRFSHMVFLCVRGVFDSAVPRRACVNARRSVAFRVVFGTQELNTQPTYTAVQRLECVLTVRPRMARGQGGSLFLSCMTHSFATPCRFIPTLSERFGHSGNERRSGCQPLTEFVGGQQNAVL